MRTDPGFAREEPRQLGMTLTIAGTADATANGRRWLLGATDLDTDSLPRLYVILNWFEELKQRVPTGGR